MFLPALVCVSVCLCVSVCDHELKIMDGFQDLYKILWEGSLGEREDQVRVSSRSVEGCGSNGQKTP